MYLHIHFSQQSILQIISSNSNLSNLMLIFSMDLINLLIFHMFFSKLLMFYQLIYLFLYLQKFFHNNYLTYLLYQIHQFLTPFVLLFITNIIALTLTLILLLILPFHALIFSFFFLF